MKLTVAFSFFILLFTPFFSRAQMEAAVWPIGSGKQINFQSGSFQYIDFKGNPTVNATICDKTGNLLLMTNGERFGMVRMKYWLTELVWLKMVIPSIPGQFIQFLCLIPGKKDFIYLPIYHNYRDPSSLFRNH